jgi:surfeit locus 1 family protein
LSVIGARRLVVLLAALAAAALTARLGFWQLDRAAQKTAAQQQLDARRALPPLPPAAWPRRADEVAAAAQRAVVLEGRWLAEHQVFLENRPMNGRAGFFALAPLALANGSVVIVQRGWLPRDPGDRTRLAAPPPPAGTVRVAGRLAAGPSRLFELAPAAPASGAIRHNLDLDDFKRSTGLPLAPFVVVQEDDPADAGPPADGLLRQWPAPASDVHKHYGYAFQWFALALLVIGLYVWFQVLQPRLTRTARTARVDRA